MKVVLFSEPLKINSQNLLDIEIHLFSQFFIHSNNIRNTEIIHCLQTNLNNPLITKIHLLNEELFSQKEMGITENFDKIIQISIGKRLQYKDVFEYIRCDHIQGYLLLSNIDIFFDESLDQLQYSTLHEKEKKQMIALLRYEYNGFSTKNSSLFGPRFDSQDTWIFHSNHCIQENQEKVFSFEFGKPGCDNKLIYLMKVLGFIIYNDPLLIKSYHYHSSLNRNYTSKDIISPPWGVIIPANLNPLSFQPSLGINLQEIITKNQTISFDDNSILRDYILNKLHSKERFIIPRISGIENNISVFVEKIFSLTPISLSSSSIQYLKNILPIMKSNAGIQITSLQSAYKYSQLYMNAFEDCDLFCGWEIQGDCINHIAESHEYILQKYLTFKREKKKQMIWAFALDIFHYIHSNPWTTALCGKRILIISSFVDSMKENILHRSKLYDDVDLFPECSFLFIRPPITNAGEISQEFDIELEEFYQKLDVLKDDYDVALLACGGYANPICSYIYRNHKKSAIYVGGVLQMYFGILGNRWITERPDILHLYCNDFWKRPKLTERPRQYEKIENGCYW